MTAATPKSINTTETHRGSGRGGGGSGGGYHQGDDKSKRSDRSGNPGFKGKLEVHSPEYTDKVWWNVMTQQQVDTVMRLREQGGPTKRTASSLTQDDGDDNDESVSSNNNAGKTFESQCGKNDKRQKKKGS